MTEQPKPKMEGAAHVHPQHAPHDHHHDHAHSHAGHHHPLPDTNRAFAIGISLNLGFVLLELFAGWWTNSLALLADAGHNFSDVIGLLLAWGAVRLALRAPSRRFTYGLGSATILAALANAVLLLLATGAIVWEALHRFVSPEPVAGAVVIGVALAGVIVNALTAALFARGRKGDLNLRGAYLHMMADAAVSLGVAVAGGLILLTSWWWFDPAISIVIALVIVWTTWGLLRESLGLALQAVPNGVDAAAVEAFLRELPGVADVHDMHIWGMSTTQTALTAHLVMPDGHPGDVFFRDLATALEHRFAIHHPTVQIETSTGEHAKAACRFAPPSVI
jgi:cobalt-zinc-cadmium efflux system protein